jgi:hypothetical protein
MAAATFVLVVIFTGSLLAAFINVRRANGLEAQWDRQLAEWHRSQLRYSELLQHFSTENCVAARLTLLNSVENLTEVQRKLDKYLASPFGESNRRFIELKHEHATFALEHYSISVKLRKTCGASLLPILYLYSGKSCSQCFFQTKILLFMEHRNRPKLLVFPVDLDFALPEQVDKIKELHAVSTLPISIIAEMKYEGFLSKEKLQIILAEDHQGGA